MLCLGREGSGPVSGHVSPPVLTSAVGCGVRLPRAPAVSAGLASLPVLVTGSVRSSGGEAGEVDGGPSLFDEGGELGFVLHPVGLVMWVDVS